MNCTIWQMFLKNRTRIFLFISYLLFFFVTSGCRGGDPNLLEREDLFTLSIGKTESQLDIFQLDHVPFTQNIQLQMADGIFYISNGNSNKIMQFNSYGDILSLLYNPDNNPMPLQLSTDSGDNKIINKRAFTYPFLMLGNFCVTKGNMLLVEDEVLEERKTYDEELEAMLDRIVLRFNRQGELVDYLGQEGIGGTPFPYIERIQGNDSGEIVIIGRTMKSWVIYWFSPEGQLLYNVSIFYDKLPVPKGLNSVMPSLETIFADVDEKKLYLKIDYYIDLTQTTDFEGNKSIGFEKSRIYTFDVAKKRYINVRELPRYFRKESSFEIFNSEEQEALYEFIGSASGGYLFFLGPDIENENELLIIDSAGKVIMRKSVVIVDRELIYRTFHISSKGILSALLCEEESAKVVWWRCDKILEEDRNE